MKVEFQDDDLRRLEVDPAFDNGMSAGLVRAFRMRAQFIRSAVDERALYAMKSWRCEKLQGKRQHQHSIRLNDQFRLIFEIEKDETGNSIRIISIEDYH